jgi:hypothetical protein
VEPLDLLLKERSMRMMTATLVLALLVTSHSAYPRDRVAAEAERPTASVSKTYTAEESAALGRAARSKAEAQERIWDLKMKTITRGICTGC